MFAVSFIYLKYIIYIMKFGVSFEIIIIIIIIMVRKTVKNYI